MARDDDFGEITEKAKARERDALRHDHGNEMADREVPRQKRFFNGGDGAVGAEIKKRRERRFRDALDILLSTDAEYRALYEELGTQLFQAEMQADEVIDSLQAGISELDQRVGNMLDTAARLPDGRRVFRYADGRVEDEIGDAVAPELAEGIQWPSNAPSAEEYFAATKKRDDLQRLLAEWQDYRNDTLGGIRDRYDDPVNPMEKDDLKEALEDIEAMRPELQKMTAPAPSTIPAPETDLSVLNIPTKLN